MGTDLTEKVLHHQKTGEGLEKILEEISLKVYRYPFRKYGWEEDDCSDFYLFFYSRLPRMVKRYRDKGFTFEAYLYASLRMQMRTFFQAKREEKLRKRICETHETFLDTTRTSLNNIPDPTQTIQPLHSGKNKLSRSMRKRIVIVFLKNFFYLTDSHIARISILTNTPGEDLHSWIADLRIRLLPEIEHLNALREKRDRVFLHIHCLEAELRSSYVRSTPDTDSILEQISLEKGRLLTIQNEISRTTIFPTHKDIAETMGIPKGTVDSGLYYLRTKYKGLYSSVDIGYA